MCIFPLCCEMGKRIHDDVMYWIRLACIKIIHKSFLLMPNVSAGMNIWNKNKWHLYHSLFEVVSLSAGSCKRTKTIIGSIVS